MNANSIAKKLFLSLFGLAAALLSLTFVEAQTTLTFDITRQGSMDIYDAVSQTTASTYSGGLKYVVETAISEAAQAGNGSLIFGAGDFDLGATYFKLMDIQNITFAGQGIDITILRNSSDEAADTEPFNCHNCDNIIIQDMTISAGGSVRNTSDALDFDYGDSILIERVKITASRGRAIVFDGKDAAGTADGNIVRDCIITGSIPLDGIQLLASNNNRVEGCTVSDVTRHGIYIAKASALADQADKPSNNNLIVNNLITDSGGYGIAINGGSENLIMGNTVTNSAFSGIQLTTSLAIPCNDNRIEQNTASQNRQYGLRISSEDCMFNSVRDNNFANNIAGTIFDNGVGTIYSQSTSTTGSTTTSSSLSFSASTSLVLYAVKDSYVVATDPSTNNGSLNSLRTDADPLTRSYLSFEVPDFSGTILSASLRVYANSTNLAAYSLYTSTNNWAEDTLTYSNAPALANFLGSFGAARINTWTEVDVTASITAPGQYTFVMASTSLTASNFSSRTGDYPPELVINLSED
jgi:parallel beta-helix repeat protein